VHTPLAHSPRRPIAPVEEPHQRQALSAFIGGALQQLQQPRQHGISSAAGGKPPRDPLGPGAAGASPGPRSLSTPEAAMSGGAALGRGPSAQQAAALRHAHSLGSASDVGGRLEASSTGSSAAAAALLAGDLELGSPVQREWVLSCRPLGEGRAAGGGGGAAGQLGHRMYVQAAAGELRVAMALVHDRGL
jgi:hypothetical protein